MLNVWVWILKFIKPICKATLSIIYIFILCFFSVIKCFIFTMNCSNAIVLWCWYTGLNLSSMGGINVRTGSAAILHTVKFAICNGRQCVILVLILLIFISVCRISKIQSISIFYSLLASALFANSKPIRNILQFNKICLL